MDRTAITFQQAKKGIEKLIYGVNDVLPTTNMTNSKMSDRKYKCMLLIIVLLITTYLVLDYNLLMEVKTGSLFQQSVSPTQWYSPFYPLSVKLLMSAHSSQYIFTPLADYFNRITRFSEIFTFVTPNMVTFTHLFISIICFKFFASDSLRSRRIGILLFEIKIFLDAFDGVIYRARSSNKVYTSNRSELGYYIDVASDILAGCALYGSLMYYYLKQNSNNSQSSKPNSENGMPQVSRRFMVFRFVSVGLLVLLSANTWDRTIQAYETILQTPAKDPKIQELQIQAFRETGTFVMLFFCKIAEGEALIQMTLFAVFVDKVWEFFWYLQYIGLTFVISLNVVTYWHQTHLEDFLKAT